MLVSRANRVRTECPCGSPIAVETFDVGVSRLKVVQSWLRYNAKSDARRKSSALDGNRPQRWPTESASEVLKLLRKLVRPLHECPRQAELVEEFKKSDYLLTSDMQPVPRERRMPPCVLSARGAGL